MEHAKLWKRILNEGLTVEAYAVDCPVLLAIAHICEQNNMANAIPYFVNRIVMAPIIVVPWHSDLEGDVEKISPADLERFTIALPFDEFYMEFVRGNQHEGMYIAATDQENEARRVHAIVIRIVNDRVSAQCFFSFLLDKGGKYCGDYRISKMTRDGFLADKEFGNPEICSVQEYAILREKLLRAESELDTSLEKLTVIFAGVLLTCLSLLSCKNIELSAKTLDEKTIRRAAKRTMRDASYFRYHTLVVKPPGAKSTSPGVEIDVMPFHKCRGHFAEYGPEFNKGLLFGKYAGRFYMSPCVKGKKEHGRVEKDYELPNVS